MNHRPILVFDKIDKFYLSIIKIIIFSIPFLPLFVSSSLVFPFITGKNFAFRVLVELAAAVWLALMSVNKEYRPYNSIMVISVLSFTFIVGVADLFGVNPFNSFWSNYERMEGYITILHLALYFIIIKCIFRTEQNWKHFFNIFVIVSVMVSLYIFIEPLSFKQSLYYLHEYGNRSASTIGNPPFLSSYLLLMVFLTLILILNTKKTYLKLFYMFAIMLNCIVIYMTASRGAIVGAFSGTAIISIYFYLKRFKDSNKKNFNKVIFQLMVGFVVIIPVIIILIYTNADLIKNDKTVSRFIMIFNEDTAVETRLYAWKMAWNGIKINPVLGWGQENFSGVYTVNHIPLVGKLTWVDRAHNIILDWLINAGILGLFSYLSIYMAAFYMIWNNLRRKIISKNEALIITTAIVAYFIQNLFTFDSINTYLIFFSLIAYIDNFEFRKDTQRVSSEKNVLSNRNQLKSCIILMSALIVFASLYYYITYIPLRKTEAYTKIIKSSSKYESYSTLLDDFNMALSYSAFGDNYIRENMLEVSLQTIKYRFYTEDGALKFIQKTIEEISKEIVADEYNLEFYNKVISLYEEIATYDPSFIWRLENLIERIRKINPEYRKIDMVVIDTLFLRKDYESAYVKLKELVDRYPDNNYWQFKLGLAEILTSRADEIDKTLNNFIHPWVVNNENMTVVNKEGYFINQLFDLVQAYSEVKNYSKAIKYYKEILSILSSESDIRLFKDDIQPLNDDEKIHIKAKLHLEMASFYRLLNDKENAKREAKEAADIDLK